MKRPNTLTIKSLIGMALQAQGSDEFYWNVVGALRERTCSEMVAWVEKNSHSRNFGKRLLAINIICQMGESTSYGSRQQYTPYAIDTAHQLLGDGLHDPDYRVQEAALFGLGYRPAPEHLAKMLSFVNSPRKALRYALAFSLGHCADERATNALLVLMKDSDSYIRDWATFGLGSISSLDSQEIRSGLLEAGTDENPSVRGEAMVGLAERKDSRVIPLIQKELDGSFEGSWAIAAAGLLADPVFLPKLLDLQLNQEIQETPHFLSALEDAIAQCSKSKSDAMSKKHD